MAAGQGVRDAFGRAVQTVAERVVVAVFVVVTHVAFVFGVVSSASFDVDFGTGVDGVEIAVVGLIVDV